MVCGGRVCGGEVCGGDVCGGEVCGREVCGREVCGGRVCGGVVVTNNCIKFKDVLGCGNLQLDFNEPLHSFNIPEP